MNRSSATITASTLLLTYLIQTAASLGQVTPAPTFSLASTFAVGTGGYGDNLAVADLNSDGKLDLVVPEYGVSVLLGNGDGTFQDPVNYDLGNYVPCVAVGDFNGDGKPDIVATTQDQVLLLLGNGDGSFQGPITIDNPGSDNNPITEGVLASDFNGDGKLDLAVANYGWGNVAVLLGNGDATFKPPLRFPTRPNPRALATGDFNADGIPDIAVTEPGFIFGVAIRLGNGDGTFKAPFNFDHGGLFSLATGDFDGDGTDDVASPIYPGGGIALLLSNGAGTFAQRTYAIGNWPDLFIDVADFNGDGKLDLAGERPPNLNAGLVVMLGNGDGTLRDPIDLNVWVGGVYCIAVGDFNGDGKPDLVVRARQIAPNLLTVLLDTSPWPTPALTAQRNGGALVLSWPLASTGFVLESSSGLGAGTWQPVGQPPVNNKGRWQVTVSSSDACRCFRLHKP